MIATERLTEAEHNAFPNGRYARSVVRSPKSEVQSPKSEVQSPGSKVQSPDLPAGEAAELTECERIIGRGLQTFIEVGTALLTIREHRLYRAEFGTFDDYCRERWGIQARQAQRLMAGALIALNVDGALTVPASESQVRPLTGLPPEVQRAAWDEAVRTAPGGQVTAKHVKDVVAKLKGEPDGIQQKQTKETKEPAGAEKTLDIGPGTLDKSPKEVRLRAATGDAIDHVRQLIALIGTADSAAGADLAVALDRLESYQDHLVKLENLQSSRPA